MNWVTIPKFSRMSGYTEKAIRNKIERLIWSRDIHWKKAPDGRIFLNAFMIEAWIIGADA